MSHEYENVRRVRYGAEVDECMLFVPVCPYCGRFVKADKSVWANGDGLKPVPNAMCSKCGLVQMPFEGWC